MTTATATCKFCLDSAIDERGVCKLHIERIEREARRNGRQINKFAGNCAICRRTVRAKSGCIESRGGKWVVYCLNAECAAPAPKTQTATTTATASRPASQSKPATYEQLTCRRCGTICYGDCTA